MSEPSTEAAPAPETALGGDEGGTATQAPPEPARTAIPSRRAEQSAAQRGRELGKALTATEEPPTEGAEGAETDEGTEEGVSPEQGTQTDLSPEQAAAQAEETGEAVVDRNGRKHDPETGQYLTEDEQDEEAEAALDEEGVVEEDTEQETDAQAAGESSEDEGADAEAAERPSSGDDATETIRVDLPENDALRQTGRAAIDVVSQADADLVKGILNREERLRSELASREQQLEERDKELVQLRSTQTASEEWKESPEYKAHVQRFRQLKRLEQQGEVEEGTASAYWKGAQSDFQALREEKYNEQWGEIQDRKAKEAGERWVRDAWGRTQSVPEPVRNIPEFRQWFNGSVQAFDRMVEQGQYGENPTPAQLHQEFQNFFGAVLMQKPAVREAYRKARTNGNPAQNNRKAKKDTSAEREKKIREEAKREGAEEMKRKMAEKREKAPPNPMGRMEHAATPEQASGEPEGEEKTPPRNRVHARKLGEARAAKRAREYMGRR